MSTKSKPGESENLVTFRQIEEFRIWAQRYQESDKKPSMLNFALTELRRSTRQHSNQLSFKRRLLENKLALTDSSNKHVLSEDGKLKYNAENRRVLLEAVNKMLDETVSIEPIWCDSIPDDIAPIFIENFIGFCIKPFTSKEEYMKFFKLDDKPKEPVATTV